MAARGRRRRGGRRGRRGRSGNRDDTVVRRDEHREHGPDGVHRPEPVTHRLHRAGDPDGDRHADAERDRHDERARREWRARDNAGADVAAHPAVPDVVAYSHRHRHGHRLRYEHPDHGPIGHLRNWLLIGLLTDPGPERRSD
jgi:hypothetical protein